MAGTRTARWPYKGLTMTNERFDDELLSAILDGEADETQIARVAKDPNASVRLERMRTVATIVSEAPEPASPERRRSSIAAAMAAAEPADPGITSLTAARHQREEQVWTPDLSRQDQPRRTRWLAIAAAIALFVLAVPIIASLRPDNADVATSATESAAEESADVVEDASAEASGSTDTDRGDAADDTRAIGDEADADEATADADDAMEDDAAEEDAMEEAESTDADTDAAADSFDAEDRPFTSFGEQVQQRQLAVVPDPEGIEELIDGGILTPTFSVDELLDAGVNPQCLENDTGLFPAQFGAVVVGTNAGDLSNVVLIRFNDDGTIERFSAQDCTPQ